MRYCTTYANLSLTSLLSECLYMYMDYCNIYLVYLGKIMIILEYFPYGNFHQFLKSHRGAFVNLVRNGTLSRDYAVYDCLYIEFVAF